MRLLSHAGKITHQQTVNKSSEEYLKYKEEQKRIEKLEQAFKLYCFDRELRLLITGELEKIEIAIRTQLIYQMSHYKGAYWFQDPSLFRNRGFVFPSNTFTLQR